jgi:hypothetical protein
MSCFRRIFNIPGRVEYDMNITLQKGLPVVILVQIYVHLNVQDHNAAVSSCRYMRDVGCTEASSPERVFLPLKRRLGAYAPWPLRRSIFQTLFGAPIVAQQNTDESKWSVRLPPRMQPRFLHADCSLYEISTTELGVLLDNPRLQGLSLVRYNQQSLFLPPILPVLRKLSLFFVDFGVMVQLLRQCGPQLTNLQLTRPPMTPLPPLAPTEIHQLLGACQNLRTLRLERFHMDVPNPHTMFHLPHVTTAFLLSVTPRTYNQAFIEAHRDTLHTSIATWTGDLH